MAPGLSQNQLWFPIREPTIQGVRRKRLWWEGRDAWHSATQRESRNAKNASDIRGRCLGSIIGAWVQDHWGAVII